MILLLWACQAETCGPGVDAYDPPVAHPDNDNHWLFDPLHISRIDLTLDAEAEKILKAERLYNQPRFTVRGQLSLDGVEVADVGVRLRGRFGSFQPYEEKPEWRIDFNYFVEGQKFYDLKAINLNNSDEDRSYLKDYAGMAVYALAGVPASRVGYAQLFVNGEDKGLMSVVEEQDDQWLERVFGRSDGNFYDGAYQINVWSPYFLDFGEGCDTAFDLEEGIDIEAVDIQQISEAVMAVQQGAPFETVAAQVEMEPFQAMLAAERWIGNDDGYGSYINNYRIYIPPGEKATLAVWDMGGTFLEEGRDEQLWLEPDGNIAELCFKDESCWKRQQEVREELEATIALSTLKSDLQAIADHLLEAAIHDPWGSCDAQLTRSSQAHVVDW